MSSEGTAAVLVLGAVRIGTGGDQLRGQLSALTTALALGVDGPMRTDVLAEIVFGPGRIDGAAALRPLVSRLRRLLRDADLGTVLSESGGLRLAAPSDVARFDELADRAAATMATDPAAAVELARRALELWRGDLHDAVAHTPPAVRLVQRRAATIELRLRGELSLGRHRECLADLLAACLDAPYDEELWRLAMVALDRCGRRADALRAYQEVRRRLVEDLGIEPGDALRRTEAIVLAGDPAPLDPPGPDDGRPRPERQRAADAPRPAGSGPTSLPRYDDRYVATGAAPRRLADALADRRQLTVIGPAGIGKTRLVVESLPQVAARWPDGIVFCELSAVQHGGAVPASVAAAAGVRVPGGMTAEAALVDALHAQRALLVLDTCEHVAAAAGALSALLLDQLPDLTVLATSRAPLHVPNERLWPMPALDADDAVALFVDRARRTDPSFAPTGDGERHDIAAVCRRLDGLPLAIELAAARIRALTPAELHERLASQRFALLAGDAGAGASAPGTRHGTLRASLAWSYDTLPPSLQELFRGLGAFAGAFRLPDAEALFPARPDVAAGIAGLVDRSLLVARRAPAGTRYRLLDSLRTYARELLDEHGELDAALARHARFVAARKDELVAAGEGPDDAAAAAELAELWPELRAGRLGPRPVRSLGGLRPPRRAGAECHGPGAGRGTGMGRCRPRRRWVRTAHTSPRGARRRVDGRLGDR